MKKKKPIKRKDYPGNAIKINEGNQWYYVERSGIYAVGNGSVMHLSWSRIKKAIKLHEEIQSQKKS